MKTYTWDVQRFDWRESLKRRGEGKPWVRVKAMQAGKRPSKKAVIAHLRAVGAIFGNTLDSNVRMQQTDGVIDVQVYGAKSDTWYIAAQLNSPQLWAELFPKE